MASRNPLYLISVMLLAIVMSVPQLTKCFEIGSDAYRMRRLPMPSIPGFRGDFYHPLTQAAFWQGQFIHVSGRYGANGRIDWTASKTDPETGKSTELDWDLTDSYQPAVYGNRLWIVGGGQSLEVVDGVARPSKFVNPPFTQQDRHLFLLNGEPARVEGSFFISTFKAGTWSKEFEIEVPSIRQSFGNYSVTYRGSTSVSCITQGDRIHGFFHTDGRLFYRQGLELQPVGVPGQAPGQRIQVGTELTAKPDSSVTATNSPGAMAEWSLVREAGGRDSWENQFGMLVGGQPAALFVDDASSGCLVARVYRLEGAKWSEVASQRLPFGSSKFRVVTCGDGQTSYVVVTTSTGANVHVYAIDTAGIRETKGGTGANAIRWHLAKYALMPAFALCCGITLGLGTGILMRKFTNPHYVFGTQSVKLASLRRRGIARLIDLALIAFSTAGLGWVMMLGFDWGSLAESLNLKVDHPTITVALRVAFILALWLVTLALALVVVQARWGLTLGKWFCGVRTLRTTLKPCGFARSLARELVMCVDGCNFLCWTPGIVSIALTDRRQRLGDLVADTLVVEARSLA